MSPRATSSFVPFEPGTGGADHSGDLGFTPTVVSATEGATPTGSKASSAPAHQHSGPEANAKPVVTLQRTGDKITSIRIECLCGQIIDLNCSY